MSLLKDIQDAVVDSNSDLPTILRKCRILASRLKNTELKNWVQHELDGYPDESELPDYRKAKSQSKGHFSGPFGSGMKNAPIPSISIPEKFRHTIENLEIRQGISSLNELVENSDGKDLHSSWSHDLIPLVAGKIYENMNLISAWREIPAALIIGILDTVRNRILNFVLEVEEETEETEDPTATSLPKEKVNNIFNNYIMGNVGNFASGSNNVEQRATVSIQQGNFASLKSFLESQGILPDDINDLKQAINSDPTPESTTNLGPKISNWIGKMLSKASQGIWKIGLPVATNILSQAIAQYFGIQ